MTILLNGTTGITTPGLINTGSTTFVDLTTTGNTILGDASTDTLNVANGNLVLDSTGELGLGVTPAAWGGVSTGRVFQTGGAAFYGRTDNSDAHVGTNFYRDSSNTYRYLTTAPAAFLQLSQHTFNWWNAPSGTAGNPITFTQAMTLDASGRLGIGTTSPSEKLQLEGSGSQYMRVKTTTTNADMYFGITSASVGYVGTGGSDPLAFYTGGTERARIDSSGNLLVGTTSSPATVWSGSRTFAYVKGNTAGNGGEVIVESNNGNQQASFFTSAITAEFGLWSTKASALLFGTNNAERARIDSSGNLLVGTTTASLGPTSGFNVIIGGGVTGTSIGHITGSSSGSYYELFAYNGSAIGSITQSGTTAVLYNTTSDQRLKENIQDADSASTLIDALKVRQFDWKSDNSHQRYGFVAQELVTVAPEAVHQPEDPDKMMAVDYSKLVPMLVKEVQSLRKRLADAGIA